ncbi:hypothetical protein A33Q_3509 [Indibacter alkaliphilus LW1]|uniref:YARHG domain-containing protein n=1 Tax=Indibacter alkaliphilus (strain CCUG 57479 / KCTC 22604 / LW1) TaxID=1189612 RepID=S2DUU9_INDAL|nr:hypothetical protein [Indibacter alkaliphilus]EOZ93563.1 hypothetical protein A33Q_3509 [Indibacter alkaliphilus LW1]
MFKKLINIFFLVFVSMSIHAQRASIMERDTIYLDEFFGVEKFEHLIQDTLIIKHGNYSFSSELFNELLVNKISKLEVNGKYKGNYYQGTWQYKLTELEVDIIGIREARNMSLEYILNGTEKNASLDYNEGLPNGLWKIGIVKINENRRTPEITGGQFIFDHGVAINDFTFDDPQNHYFVRGVLNEEGFFDGDLILRFKRNREEIKETRFYQNGFLLKLSRFNESKGELEAEIIFNDVQKQLEDADGKIEEINFTISQEGFGVLFQNGYNLNDNKLTEQEEGNLILEEVIERYRKFSRGHDQEREEPKFNLTRRFKFIYPEEEGKLIRNVRPRLNIMLEEYNDFLSNAKFILNRERMDSLPYIFGFIDHARRKAQDMLDVIALTEDGFFDFLYRPNYYPNGLPNLNQADSFNYEEAGEEKEAEFDLGIYVDSPYRIMEQIEVFTDTLKQQTDEYLDYAFMEIRIFDEQATIDSLDNQIVQLKSKADALYSFLQVIPEDRTFEEMPLDYRVYRVIHNNSLQRLQNEYLDAENYDEKVKVGEELTCMLDYLIDQHEEILFIEEMPDRLDKEFTRFSPNPFFERDIETKILPAIYGKGTGPLFKYYAENLFESRNCKDLQSNLEKFRKLENRLKELVKRSDTEEVVRLDRALRRENIPNRIERLLNL